MNRSLLTLAMAVLLVTSLVAMTGIATAGDDEIDPDEDAEWLREEADRLQGDLFNHVVWEINNQSQDTLLNMKIAVPEYSDYYDPQTPDEARQLGDDLYDEFTIDEIDEAREGLYDAAEGAENFTSSLEEAADDLETADDPTAEAERIDEEVIAVVNEELEQGANDRFEEVDPVPLMDTLLGDIDPGEENGDDDADDGADDADDADDEADDDGMAAGFVAVAAIGALLGVAAVLRRR